MVLTASPKTSWDTTLVIQEASSTFWLHKPANLTSYHLLELSERLSSSRTKHSFALRIHTLYILNIHLKPCIVLFYTHSLRSLLHASKYLVTSAHVYGLTLAMQLSVFKLGLSVFGERATRCVSSKHLRVAHSMEAFLFCKCLKSACVRRNLSARHIAWVNCCSTSSTRATSRRLSAHAKVERQKTIASRRTIQQQQT